MEVSLIIVIRVLNRKRELVALRFVVAMDSSHTLRFGELGYEWLCV